MVRGRDNGETDQGRKDPLELYQRYDRINRRQGWEEALHALGRDVTAGRQPLDRRQVARRYGLPEDWDWQDVERQLRDEPKPLEAFNSLLRVVFRGLA